jgi:ubiquinone/menaquinone biosynthesis C-methylase UbiE
MSNAGFRLMTLAFQIVDFFHPHIKKRVQKFGIEAGMVVVDYGCGPGRYAVKLAELVGDRGKVYAVDIHELAIEAVRKKTVRDNITNIEPVLARGYESTLPADTADVLCAIDMFFMLEEPTVFLTEAKRILKPDGTLVIDDGHQSRSATREKILASGLWDIVEERKDHLKCRPRRPA